MNDPVCWLANSAWLAVCRPAYRRLQNALIQPRQAQAAVLARLLTGSVSSAFGRAHGFGRVGSIAEFQSAVQASDYEGMGPWIERAKAGEQNVLTGEPVLMFERSSGSGAPAKYVPYTAGLRREFQEAIRAWMADLHRHHAGLRGGPAYWLMSPLREPKEVTSGGIPVGFATDDEYLGKWEQRLAHRLFAVPAGLAQIKDLEANLNMTLRFLLQEPGLRLISAWNPSWLVLLWARFAKNADLMLESLASGKADALAGCAGASNVRRFLQTQPGRARGLREKLRVNGSLRPVDLWPELTVISCWGDGAAAADLKEMSAVFPGTAIQPKGLLATEGVVTLPWGDPECAAVPALNSHFFEFMELPDGPTRLVDELEQGREYAVLLSTGGGLWRYRLGDAVRVEGWADATPRLRFAGRVDGVSDLRGEKLSPRFVESILAPFGLKFAMLAPGQADYTLFFEAAECPDQLGSRVEGALLKNPHYAHCRAVGQLGPVRLFRIRRGATESYVRRCVELGQRAGGVKPAGLHRAGGWEEWFENCGQADS